MVWRWRAKVEERADVRKFIALRGAVVWRWLVLEASMLEGTISEGTISAGSIPEGALIVERAR